MNRKSKAEMERAKIAKVARTLIRLKHSLAADEELNEILPDKLEEFDQGVLGGEIKRLKTDLGDVLGD